MSRRYYYRRPTNAFESNRKPRRKNRRRRWIIVVITAAAVIGGLFFVFRRQTSVPFLPAIESEPEIVLADASDAATVLPQSTPAPLPTANPGNFAIAPSAATNPSAYGFQSQIEQNGSIVSSFISDRTISFPAGADYNSIDGITTFRSNNYRDASSLGRCALAELKFEKVWTQNSGTIDASVNNYLSEPLIVRWDADIAANMNRYPVKQEIGGLTEVIVASSDGKIYFMDLSDGGYTRDPIDTGYESRAVIALDPRGYPLLYAGQTSRASQSDSNITVSFSIYSLLNGQLLYQYNPQSETSFALRTSSAGFLSSPLIAADADVLIWAGEDGVLYETVLNSEFDRAAGSVSVNPEAPVKYRYTTSKNADDAQLTADKPRKYGTLASLCAWKNYAFMADQGGWLQCIDLNTLKPVYVQDLIASCDASPVIEQTPESIYLYAASKASLQPQEGQTGTAYLRKLNAATGEILWQTPYECRSSGGVYASPVIGEGALAGVVYFTVAEINGTDAGKLAALDCENGQIIWEYEMEKNSTSSPAAVYSEDDAGYLLQGDNNGILAMLDGVTGEVLDRISLGGTGMGTPSVYGNMLVVCSDNGTINGIRIK